MVLFAILYNPKRIKFFVFAVNVMMSPFLKMVLFFLCSVVYITGLKK